MLLQLPNGSTIFVRRPRCQSVWIVIPASSAIVPLMKCLNAKSFLLPILLTLGACNSKSESPAKEAEPTVVQQDKTVRGRVLNADEIKTLDGLEGFISDAYLEKIIATRDSEHWYGLYMAGQKAGYAVLRMRKTEGDEPGVFVIQYTIHLQADGDSTVIESSSFFAGEPSYEALETHTSEATGTGKVTRNFVRDGTKTLIETSTEGKRGPDTWAPEMCGSLRIQLAEMAPEFSTITTGSKGKACNFEADEQSQYISEIRVASMGTQLISGVKVKVMTLETKHVDSDVWMEVTITEDGTSLAINMGNALSLKLEDKNIAQSDILGVDINTGSIKLERPLNDPESIKELKLRATFFKGFKPPPSTPNQQVEKQADGSYHLTIRSVPGAKVLPEEKKEALASTPDINSSDPTIVAMAKTLTADSKTDREKVAVLNHWVFENLDKSLSTNLSTASQVLAHKTGDCTEHTILLLALLRAVNIPARELAGLVYLDGDFSAFGWHAWTEVAVDGYWVQVDPSWDELVGNATHINLGLDDGMANLGTMTLQRL